MDKPILTREEILKLWDSEQDPIFPELVVDFAAALESAWLEKLRGEAVAYATEEGLRMISTCQEICVWSFDSPLRRKSDIPLYALKTGDES